MGGENATVCNINCENGGLCTKDKSSAEACTCPKPFLGRYCELDRDECAEAASVKRALCFNDGVCFNTHGAYECVCPAKYKGHHCESLVSISLPFFGYL